MERTTIWINREKRDQVVSKSGVPFSEWIRGKVEDYLNDNERIAAGKTQINPAVINGGGHAA